MDRDVSLAGEAVTLPPGAAAIARGVGRLLRELGCGALAEFVLPSGRRLDMAAIDGRGRILGIEIKSSVADFRADAKWPEYRAWCDALYFAVATEFPQEILPGDCGLIVADAHGGAVLRAAPEHPLAPARRKAITLRFGLVASARLARLLDPADPACAPVGPA